MSNVNCFLPAGSIQIEILPDGWRDPERDHLFVAIILKISAEVRQIPQHETEHESKAVIVMKYAGIMRRQETDIDDLLTGSEKEGEMGLIYILRFAELLTRKSQTQLDEYPLLRTWLVHVGSSLSEIDTK